MITKTIKKIMHEVTEDFTCSKCGAKMEYIGVMQTSMPPKYVHKCTKCDNRESLEKIYPRKYFVYEGEK